MSLLARQIGSRAVPLTALVAASVLAVSCGSAKQPAAQPSNPTLTQSTSSAAGHRISVSEIAFAWGFNSSAHFCRVFKAQYGVAPREFQRREAERALASASLTH